MVDMSTPATCMNCTSVLLKSAPQLWVMQCPFHAVICVYFMCLCLTRESYRDVFSAGASHYGVADLELLAQETHKFESRYLDQLIGPYPADKQTYVERSPIHALDKFTAPTAFFQVRFSTLVIVLAVHML